MSWASWRKYYDSPRWRRLRLQVMRRSGGWCEQCWQRPLEHVHHLTYTRFGGLEQLGDLLGVCQTCHSRLHE